MLSLSNSPLSLSRLALRVSAAAARANATVDQLVRLLRESRRFGWIALQVLTADEPQRWEFAWPPEHENEVLLRAEARTDCVSVAIDGAIAAEHGEDAELLLGLVAQQVAHLVHRRELASRNSLLADEVRVINEQIALAKFMDRAKRRQHPLRKAASECSAGDRHCTHHAGIGGVILAVGPRAYFFGASQGPKSGILIS
jgi:hypothetical protein